MNDYLYDAAIIGAGVIGSMTARELSMYDLRLCVIEAGEDFCEGASKANSGIVHAGYDAEPGSLKAKMNLAGCAMMENTARELGVPYENCGSLVIAFSEEEEQKLKELYGRGIKNGVPVEMVSSGQAGILEPALSDKITGALYARTAGIINPYELTIAAAENASQNGAEFFFGSRVTGISKGEGCLIISAGKHNIKTKYIINAAGVYADEISSRAGGETFSLRTRKGEYVVFDTAMPARTQKIIFGAPSEKGKGILVTPTMPGNMLAGPTSEYTGKEDRSTSGQGLNGVLQSAKRYVPSIDFKYAIAEFSGLRAVPESRDFIIERSVSQPRLINAAGIESPGLTAAPAIAKYVISLLFETGLERRPNPQATRERKPIEKFSEADENRKRELIAADPAYANIVCRCLHVTEAEVRQSIRRHCGARTVDGVKFRTGAGMGRCHSGFCLSRVMSILAEETGKSLAEITKNGDGSYILAGKTKGGAL